MATAIKNENNFTGLEQINKNKKLKSYKIYQYADDLSLYIGFPEQILCSLDIVISFGNISGLTLNMEKTIKRPFNWFSLNELNSKTLLNI